MVFADTDEKVYEYKLRRGAQLPERQLGSDGYDLCSA